MSFLGLDDAFASEVLKKAEKRAAKPIDHAQEAIQSASGVFHEVEGRLVNLAEKPAAKQADAPPKAPAPVEPSAEEMQGYELIKEAEGSLIMSTLDAPEERARCFAALAALKRGVGLDPNSCVYEAEATLERLPADREVVRARALLELARPGARAPQLDRLALMEAKGLIAELADCDGAKLRAEMALLEFAAGADPSATLAAAKKILSYTSVSAFASTLAEVASAEARCQIDPEETYGRARAILERSEIGIADALATRAQFVRHRADAGQIDKAYEELDALAASADPIAAKMVIRARGFLATAFARAGSVPSTQTEILYISREPNPATAPEAIEALCAVTRALADSGYSRAAISMRDSALVLLKQLQAQGVKKLPGSCIEAVAVAIASCGGIDDARQFASYAGPRRVHAEAEVALAIARAGVGLVRDAQKRRQKA